MTHVYSTHRYGYEFFYIKFTILTTILKFEKKVTDYLEAAADLLPPQMGYVVVVCRR